MSDKMDLILEKLDSQEKMITQLLQIVGATNTKVSNIEKSVDELKTDVKDLKNSVAAVVQTQEEQNDLFDTIARRSIEHETKIKKLQASKRII
jgi:hypothetical protein